MALNPRYSDLMLPLLSSFIQCSCIDSSSPLLLPVLCAIKPSKYTHHTPSSRVELLTSTCPATGTSSSTLSGNMPFAPWGLITLLQVKIRRLAHCWDCDSTRAHRVTIWMKRFWAVHDKPNALVVPLGSTFSDIDSVASQDITQGQVQDLGRTGVDPFCWRRRMPTRTRPISCQRCQARP